jgi:hypothetical protein
MRDGTSWSTGMNSKPDGCHTNDVATTDVLNYALSQS